jgi:hypothetical protein
MGSGCCDNQSEETHNELYIAYMTKMSKFMKKLHPKSCNDKCGCFSSNITKLSNNSKIVNTNLISTPIIIH